MIPVDVTLDTPNAQKKFHFEVVENPQLTPTLVAVTTFNGIVGSPVSAKARHSNCKAKST